MSSTYAPAVESAAPASPVQARLVPRSSTSRVDETLQFVYGDQVCGYVFLPNQVAYDLISRLQEPAATLSQLTPEVVGHVRHVLEIGYGGADDVPDNWIVDMITMIKSAPPEQRDRIRRIYPAYVWVVEIATGPGGLAELRRAHDAVSVSGPRPLAGG